MTNDNESNAQQIYDACEQRRCELHPDELGYRPWLLAPSHIKEQYRKVARTTALEAALQIARTWDDS